jgi:hypothetical protein
MAFAFGVIAKARGMMQTLMALCGVFVAARIALLESSTRRPAAG